MSLRKIGLVLSIIVLLIALGGMNYAGETKHQYVGVAMCKGCHSNDAVGGTEYKNWETSSHAKAYDALASDHAKEVAEEAGIEGNPQESDECLRCHVTAWEVDADLRAKSWKKEGGVECETCHGAGKDYMPMAIMKDHDKAVENGLIVPDKELCITCHNDESPTQNEFKEKEMLEKIKHWEDEEE